MIPLLFLLVIANSYAKGIDAGAKTITLALQSEPPSLDPTLTTDVTSGQILAMTNEGLVYIGKRNEVVPAVAERWEQDGLDVTFYLREAKWSNGEPVTAQDFEYGFKRLVDPKSGAAGSTFFAYLFENAEEILRGEKPVDSLGVKAIDDRTFKIRLSRPAPYFLTVLAGTPWRPLKQSFVEAQGERYAADAKNLMSNGPYMLTSWVHSSSLKLERNPHYWNTEKTHLKAIDFGYITTDTRSLLNLYKSNQLAALRLNEDILKDTMQSGLRVKKAPTNCISWIMFNMRPERITANKKIREAIRYVLDRDRYANTIVGLPGTLRADSIFPSRAQGVNGPFLREYPAKEFEYNLKKGRALIAEVKQDLGVEKLPPIVMLINDTRQIEAEFVQSQLMNSLDLDVRVDKQTFKQSLVKFRTGEFDIARSGFCSGAIQDPVLFANIFTSKSPFNDMAFYNDRYDALMEITHSSADQKVRMDAFNEMQHILYEEVPVVPTIESSWVYIQDDDLSGLKRYPNTDFSEARIMGQAE